MFEPIKIDRIKFNNVGEWVLNLLHHKHYGLFLQQDATRILKRYYSIQSYLYFSAFLCAHKSFVNVFFLFFFYIYNLF